MKVKMILPALIEAVLSGFGAHSAPRPAGDARSFASERRELIPVTVQR